MIRHRAGRTLLLCFFIISISSSALFSQRVGFTKQELTGRRKALMDRLEEGMVVLFGDCLPSSGGHFRQDNDFYYLTGIEDTGAILIMAPKTNESFLFLPRQTPREIMIEGENLLGDEDAPRLTGFTGIHPVSYFDEFIARNATRFGQTFHLRLSPRDTVDNARSETLIFEARKNRTHYNDQISLDNYRIQKLRQRYPEMAFNDITPFIDEMRLIKSAEERQILRRNGILSAEAVKQAILATEPGIFEYQIEAAAMHVILKGGARGVAYPPIVGSGPNSCIWHYDKNSRKVQEGELVLMDFGADLDYLCMDITRTWPVSGRFTPEQREVYKIVLAVQKACIEAYKPGITSEDVQRHVASVMKQKGIDTRGLKGGVGHYVGMCVHDVGPRNIPLKEGMVFAIEPALYYPENNIGIRIEDTVLITKDGCEVLTKDVPKELEEIERLMSRKD